MDQITLVLETIYEQDTVRVGDIFTRLWIELITLFETRHEQLAVMPRRLSTFVHIHPTDMPEK